MAVYNIPYAVKLTGPLDAAALQKSLNEVVRRHESLRTAFVTANGGPVQVIAPSCTVTISIIDLQDLATEEQQAAVSRLNREEANRPFDLTRAPLLRARPCCGSPNPRSTSCRLTMHHMVSDGWSTGILFRELAVALSRFLRRESNRRSSASSRSNMRTFARWQRALVRIARFQKTRLTYWKQRA